MTNDEAIQRLKEGAPFSALWDKQWEEALSMAIEALENEDRLVEDLQNFLELYRKKKAEVEALKQTQWIPCSERLPEEDGQYLITVKYVHVDGYDDIYAEHGEWTDGKWDMFCFGHCGEVESVLAWMPLPEPWKGESE